MGAACEQLLPCRRRSAGLALKNIAYYLSARGLPALCSELAPGS